MRQDSTEKNKVERTNIVKESNFTHSSIDDPVIEGNLWRPEVTGTFTLTGHVTSRHRLSSLRNKSRTKGAAAKQGTG